jgi:hypothetical protein
MFPGFCSPCAPANQVKPFIYNAEDKYRVENAKEKDEEKENSLYMSSSMNFKVKPPPNRDSKNRKSFSQSSELISGNGDSLSLLEQEMYFFTMDLSWKLGNIADYQYSLLTTSDKAFLYYDCSALSSSSHIKSSLVLVLRNTLAGKAIAFNKENIWTLLTYSLSSLIDLLKAYEKSSKTSLLSFLPSLEEESDSKNQNKKKPTSPSKRTSATSPFSSSSPLIQSFNSIEHTFMTIDILLGAFLNHFNSDMELLYSNNQQQSIIRDLVSLLSSSYSLMLLTDEDSRPVCAIAFGHIMIKIYSFLMIILKHFHLQIEEIIQKKNSSSSSPPVSSSSSSTSPASSSSSSLTLSGFIQLYFHDFIDLFPILNQNIFLLKSCCNEESLHYYLTITSSWNIYEKILSFIIQLDLICLEDKYKMILKLYQQKMISCLLVLLPTSQDIFSEIKQMEQSSSLSATAAVATGNSNNGNDLYHSALLKSKNGGGGGGSGGNHQRKEDYILSLMIKELFEKEKENEEGKVKQIGIVENHEEKEDESQDKIKKPSNEGIASVTASKSNSPRILQTDKVKKIRKTIQLFFSFRFRHFLIGLIKLLSIYLPTPLPVFPSSLNVHYNTLLHIQRY